ncbi:MAG: hypothetical protein H6963_12870 [Chromatiaceae bacterium]|nr:hypothetical protein [Chromatiaceae bacterium]
MKTITRLIQGCAKASVKTILALLLMSPFLALGETGSEKPIENLVSIAGEWSGSGKDRAGSNFSITYDFHEDGSFKCQVDLGFKKKTCDRGPGTLRLNNGKLEWENERGIPYVVTLSTSEEGNRSLTGIRADGVTWTVKTK